MYNFSRGARGMEAVPKGAFGIIPLARDGSIYFFQTVQQILVPNGRKSSTYGDDRFNYENAVKLSDNTSYQHQQEYEQIGGDL